MKNIKLFKSIREALYEFGIENIGDETVLAIDISEDNRVDIFNSPFSAFNRVKESISAILLIDYSDEIPRVDLGAVGQFVDSLY